ncbi:hypothetical protein BC937DRAFT_88831 [Endogone sp. FLAS-F59071]|nr:hypothetical protein BC937DRAFT_88831 [Endogone sp. FLAS-F59071]|eukprot:RUS18371.1 hypothetical protein BC937DRAFT_88831 [Endogone sp. FLAS-F59071]
MSILPAVISRRPALSFLLTSFQSPTSDSDFALTYPTNLKWPPPRPDGTPTRIAILDASFNPPTLAHRALLFSTLAAAAPPADFDAALLLFSITNADKQLHGAGVLERVMMMEIIARGMAAVSFDSDSSTSFVSRAMKNLAVGITKHARFLDKAESILSWHRTQHPPSSPPLDLHFIMGLDTILRLFSPRYYAPTPVAQALQPFFARSRVVWANRAGIGDEEAEQFWQSEDVAQFADRVMRVQIGEDMEAVSSTKAREAVAEGKWEEVERLVGDVTDFVKGEGLYRGNT